MVTVYVVPEPEMPVTDEPVTPLAVRLNAPVVTPVTISLNVTV